MNNLARLVVLLTFGIAFPGCSCISKPTATADPPPEKSSTNEPNSSKESSTQKSNPVAPDSNAGNAPSKTSLPSKPPGNQGAKKGEGTDRATSIASSLIGGGRNDEKVTTSPQFAYQQASELEKAAVELEKKGKPEEAFPKALAAWQLAREHLDDAACSRLCRNLEPLLSRLGEAASVSSSQYRTIGKPLQIE